jgi:thymidylate synthase (FAD)
MQVEVLSQTKEPEKTCAVSMRSTRTREPAHVLWKKSWITECPVKVNRERFDICPKDELFPEEKCDFYNVCAVRLLRKAKHKKHWGIFEHATFTVSVSGISRSCTHQLVRHRLFSYLQSSSRRIDFGKFTLDDFVIPRSANKPSIYQKFRKAINSAIKTYEELTKNGVLKENARFVLPQATPQHIVITGNARNWLHFFYLRMSKQAQWEIREMAQLICKKLLEISPVIFEGAGKWEC